MPEKQVKKLRIVFVGPERVGKTALISRIRGYAMPLRYLPTTVEDEYSHNMALLRNEPHPVVLVDTTGSITELGRQTRNESVVFADAIVLVFSMRDRDSFDTAMEMLRTVEATRAGRPCPVLVVGNQSDEADDNKELSMDMTNAIFSEIEVRRESSEVGFVVVSALEDRNISTIEHRLSDIFEPMRATKSGLRRLFAAVSRSSLHSTSSKKSRTSSIFSIDHRRSASFSTGVRNKLKRNTKSGSQITTDTLMQPGNMDFRSRTTSCPQIADENGLKWHVSPLNSPPMKMSPASSAEHSRAPSELEEIIEDMPDKTTALEDSHMKLPRLAKPMSPDSGVEIVVTGTDGTTTMSPEPPVHKELEMESRQSMLIVSSL
eukprot:scpid53051/ scgid17422/ 